MGFLINIKGKKEEEIGLFLESAVESIIAGRLVAFPTNSVYGIGGDPLNLDLIERIFNIKYRDRSKGFLLLVSDFEEASKIAEFNDKAKKLANHFWPGQLTLILKRKKPNIIPLEVTAYQETIGLRVPENKIILNILNRLKSKGKFGGIIGTSANFSGEPPAISGAMVAKNFLGAIDFILDSGKSESKIATTIVDCTSEEVELLRIGKITEEEITNVLSNEKNDLVQGDKNE